MPGVKVCGMQNADNLKEIIKTAPDFIGFIFYPKSPRYVGNPPEYDLIVNVPSGIKKVGVFVNENIENIIQYSLYSGLDMIQLHGSESPSFCLKTKSQGLPVIKAFGIGGEFNFNSLEAYKDVCDYFLFDTRSEGHGGSGHKFEWNKLNDYSLDKPFFLSGGIGPDDTDLIRSITNKGLFAIDINSRFEVSPGIKDAIKVKNFIEKIKE